MLENVKVAIIVEVADGEVYRRACAIAERAWDAGAEVRVRRARGSDQADVGASDVSWGALLSAEDDVPELHAEDIDWADIVVSGLSDKHLSSPILAL